jgi:hypothetical protein
MAIKDEQATRTYNTSLRVSAEAWQAILTLEEERGRFCTNTTTSGCFPVSSFGALNDLSNF